MILFLKVSFVLTINQLNLISFVKGPVYPNHFCTQLYERVVHMYKHLLGHRQQESTPEEIPVCVAYIVVSCWTYCRCIPCIHVLLNGWEGKLQYCPIFKNRCFLWINLTTGKWRQELMVWPVTLPRIWRDRCQGSSVGWEEELGDGDLRCYWCLDVYFYLFMYFLLLFLINLYNNLL